MIISADTKSILMTIHFEFFSIDLYRGKWFQNNSAAVVDMRLRIARFCSHMQLESPNAQHNQFKIVIYQRDVDRRIIDLESALILVKNKLGLFAPDLLERIKIFVVDHEEDRHPCALYHLLGDADILLTAHGFQSTALLLMKPGAMLIEIFNYKYWKVHKSSSTSSIIIQSIRSLRMY
jgi:hypothetical protein